MQASPAVRRASGSPVLRALTRISDIHDCACQAAAVATMAAFASVMLVGVFYRYVLNDSLMWSDELSTILFGWSVFLFIASAYRHDQHLHVDVLLRG
jgi:TRAP-type C4-dicarboxylate transport system permease small subunit